MVADWSLGMLVVVALKAAEVALAGTVMEAGTERVELELVRVTLAPPVGAALVRVTVQEVDAFCPRLVGLQAREETRTAAESETVVLAEVLL